MNLPSSGVRIFKAALSPASAEALLQVARSLYAALEARKNDDAASLAEMDLRKSNDLWGGLRLSSTVALCHEDDIVGGLTLMAAATTVVESICGRWSTIPLVAWEHSFLRRLTPEKPAGVPWHCDAEAASTMLLPGWEQIVSAWVPLVAVGESLPTLEVAVGSNAVMREQELVAANHRDAAWVEGLALEKIAPTLDPGDAIAFDQTTLHRTQQVAVTAERVTLEVRFVP